MTLRKLIITFFLIFQTLSAQSVVYISNQNPVVGDEINVYTYQCGRPIDESIVEIAGQTIKVFVRFGQNSGGICPSPPIPRTIALINGLTEGTYNLEYYAQFPPVGTFPPLPIDYPLYFNDSVQFDVFGGLVIVDSLSNLSLKLLIVLILFIGLFVVKKNRLDLLD